MRRNEIPLTKIIATLGPASANAAMIERLLDGGVSVFRINLSHGDLASHTATIATIRTIAQARQSPVAILADLPGPKIRLGEVEAGGLSLNAGDKVILQTEITFARPEDRPRRFCSTWPGLVHEVQVGERVLINDGAVRMLVIDRDERCGELVCRVTEGGIVSSGKGINLPESELSIPALTDRDRVLARWAVEQQIDYLGLSFVRRAADIEALREFIDDAADEGAPRPSLIAKIEHPRAVQNIDAILDAADGVMVARGDLGVEMDVARVPVIQKQLIQQAHYHGKPVIVATQMLESMIRATSPTRAEMSDIANAVFDEVDAVMLSGETAVGDHPALAVEYMRRAAAAAEAYLAMQPGTPAAPRGLIETRHRVAALAHGVWTVQQDLGAKLIIVWSQTGAGARLLSQNNFRIPIIATSSDECALRHMQLLRGVVPVHMRAAKSLAAWTREINAWVLEHGWATPGDICVLLAGQPLETPHNADTVSVHEVTAA